MPGGSSNFEDTESGQFDMGMAWYTCICDIMFLEIHSRETSERYAMMGKLGDGFQTGLKEPDMGYFGTRIRLTARPDVDPEDVLDMVRMCAEMSTIKTVISMHNDAACTGQSILRGTGEVKPKKLREMMAFDHIGSTVLSNQNTCVLADDDVEIAYNVSVGRRISAGNRGVGPAYLCGIPTSYRHDGEYSDLLSGIAVNIKDERKQRHNPDREKFKDGVGGMIEERTEALITRHTRSVCGNITTFSECLSDMGARIMDSINLKRIRDRGMHDEDGIEAKCLDMRPRIKHFSDLLLMPGPGMNNEKERLDNIITEPGFLITDSMRSRTLCAIHAHNPGIEVVRIPKYAENRHDFERAWIKSVCEYVGEHRIRINRDKGTLLRNICAYGHPYRISAGFTVVKSDSIPDDVVIASKFDLECLGDVFPPCLWGVDLGFKFAKQNSVGNGYGGIRFDEWYRRHLGNYIYETSMGVKALNKVFPLDKNRHVEHGSNSDAVLADSGNILAVIAGSGDKSRCGRDLPFRIYSYFANPARHAWLGSNPWVKSKATDAGFMPSYVPRLSLAEINIRPKILECLGSSGMENLTEDGVSSGMLLLIGMLSRTNTREITGVIIEARQKHYITEYDIQNHIFPVMELLDSKLSKSAGGSIHVGRNGQH